MNAQRARELADNIRRRAGDAWRRVRAARRTAGQATPLTFDRLRRLNARPCQRGHGCPVEQDERWGLSDWAVAFGGEAGDALGVVKKLRRDALGLPGNTKSRTELTAMLGEELADAIRCADLLAACAGIDLERAIVGKFDRVSAENGFPERLGNGNGNPAAIGGSSR